MKINWKLNCRPVAIAEASHDELVDTLMLAHHLLQALPQYHSLTALLEDGRKIRRHEQTVHDNPYAIHLYTAKYCAIRDSFLGFRFHEAVAFFATQEEAVNALHDIRERNDRESEEAGIRVDEDCCWRLVWSATGKEVDIIVHPRNWNEILNEDWTDLPF